MRRTMTIALATFLAAAGAAVAQPRDAATDDLACMVVTMIAGSKVTDPAAKQGIMAGFGYYMGRLKGREPGIDLKTRLIVESKAMVADPVRMRTEATRCGADMQAWGRETKEIGQALIAEGR